MNAVSRAPFAGAAISQPNIEKSPRAPQPQKQSDRQMGDQDDQSRGQQMGGHVEQQGSWAHPLRRPAQTCNFRIL